MASQSQAPTFSLFCSRVRPCTFELPEKTNDYSDQLSSFSLKHFAESECVFHLWKEADFNGEGNEYFHIPKSFGNLLNSVVVRKEERSIMSFASDSLPYQREKSDVYLRTAQIQINRITVLCKIDGSVTNTHRIISTKLRMNMGN